MRNGERCFFTALAEPLEKVASWISSLTVCCSDKYCVAMTEIVPPRRSPCHIISLLSYQVQIKPAVLAVNVVIEQTGNTLFMYQPLTQYQRRPPWRSLHRSFAALFNSKRNRRANKASPEVPSELSNFSSFCHVFNRTPVHFVNSPWHGTGQRVEFHLQCPSGAHTLSSRHCPHLSCVVARFIFNLCFNQRQVRSQRSLT